MAIFRENYSFVRSWRKSNYIDMPLECKYIFLEAVVKNFACNSRILLSAIKTHKPKDLMIKFLQTLNS